LVRGSFDTLHVFLGILYVAIGNLSGYPVEFPLERGPHGLLKTQAVESKRQPKIG